METDEGSGATPEAVRAMRAVLELLASTLDAALPLVTDAGRDRRLEEIAAACARIGFLGEVAHRLGVADWRRP